MTAGDGTAPLALATQNLVERVFGAVTALRDRLPASGWPGGRESLHRRERQLRDYVMELLSAHRDIVVGMGLIAQQGAAVGGSPAAAQRLQWWQYVAGREQPSALRVDLNPDSIGFYDCDDAEWFRVPRRSGRRHIVGPYVDAHGTDRDLLTFTVPVLAGEEFLGVVGADVPVSVFENKLLGAWGRQGGHDVMIVNEQRRVVASNSPGALCGDLLPAHAADSAERIEVPGAPWQLLVVNRGP